MSKKKTGLEQFYIVTNNKGKYCFFRTKEDFENYNSLMQDEIAHCARVMMLDYVTLALHEMGFGEKRFRQLDEKLVEVTRKYKQEYFEDLKDDEEAWYARDQFEKALKQAVGKMYAPWEERYGG